MTAYTLTRLVHVLVAVLGVGTITAGALLARPSSGIAPTALRSLVRLASVSLALMFVSGGLLDYFAAGAWHRMTWFRIAAGTTVASGIAIGVARRALAQAIAGNADGERAVQRAGGAMWLAFGLVTVIVILMVRRPFA
jgi:hypothetical protein